MTDFSFSHLARALAAVALPTLALLSTACDDDLHRDIDDGRISFTVQSDAPTVSRSADDADRWWLDVDGDSVPLSLSQGLNDDFDWRSDGASRGEPFGSKALSEIVVSGYTSSGAKLMENEVISVSGSSATSSHFWPQEAVSFFAHATSMTIPGFAPTYSMSGGVCTGSLGAYTVPHSADGTKDAEAQPDIVVAIAPNRDRAGGAVDLKFHHALSALVFKMGQMPPGTTVQSIEISGVHGSGTCTFAASGTDGVDYTWALTDAATQSYKQVYTHTMDATGPLGDATQTFMLMPQAIGADATLTINFKIEGRGEYTLSKKLNTLSVTEWKPDHRYEFTIGILADEMDVEVSDKVVGKVKSDLQIKNTGLASGYIRATMVGFWVNASGAIVAPWRETDGTFNGLTGSDWTKSSTDGFYYYTQPVAPGATTSKLFETYTLTAAPPVEGAHLELTILAQIVIESDLKTAWPDSPFTP